MSTATEDRSQAPAEGHVWTTAEWRELAWLLHDRCAALQVPRPRVEANAAWWDRVLQTLRQERVLPGEWRAAIEAIMTLDGLLTTLMVRVRVQRHRQLFLDEIRQQPATCNPPEQPGTVAAWLRFGVGHPLHAIACRSLERRGLGSLVPVLRGELVTRQPQLPGPEKEKRPGV